MKKFLNRVGIIVAAVAALMVAPPAYAQTAVTATTLSAAISTNSATIINLTSGTGVAAGNGIFVDREFMVVVSTSSPYSTTAPRVQRGMQGSGATTHASGTVAYVGPASSAAGPGPFVQQDPQIGTCTYANEAYSLRINVATGRIWSCAQGVWLNSVDSFVFVPASACQSSVSGNSTGTNGYTTIGTAPSFAIVQAQTSVTGTNTHYYHCQIPVPTRLSGSKSAYLVDAEFYYGVQTTTLGTQVATLASGTMNSTIVFNKVTFPTPGASETATGSGDSARADAGTLTITPAVGSFNIATTTAGKFYSALFTPATPFALNADHALYFLQIGLLNTATSATVTNSPGFIVHYRTLFGF